LANYKALKFNEIQDTKKIIFPSGGLYKRKMAPNYPLGKITFPKIRAFPENGEFRREAPYPPP
jgi:hypothetical protein